MKKKFFGLILLIFGVSLLHAQPPGGGRGGFDPQEMIEREKETVLKKVEGLSEDQTMLISGIYDEFGTTLKETFEEVRKNRNFSEMRTKMEGLRAEKDLLIKDVLNEEQYTTYLGIVASSRPARPGGDQ